MSSLPCASCGGVIPDPTKALRRNGAYTLGIARPHGGPCLCPTPILYQPTNLSFIPDPAGVPPTRGAKFSRGSRRWA